MPNLAYQPEHYTTEDYQHWEGDWELIEGIPYAMSPAPALKHQTLSMGLARLLDEALDPCPHCRALFETDIYFSSDTVVRPDLLIICHTPEGEFITRAPDLVVEIISPRRARHDEHTKFQLYQSEGVAYYLIAYPDERKIKAWQLIDGNYRKIGDFHDQSLDLTLNGCPVTLNFAKLWQKKTASPMVV